MEYQRPDHHCGEHRSGSARPASLAAGYFLLNCGTTCAARLKKVCTIMDDETIVAEILCIGPGGGVGSSCVWG
jgi:hypothetical protein